MQTCNCDHLENKWFSDEGRYEDTASLGIMNMYFLQQKDLTEESQGRITLGPLECVETSNYLFLKLLKSFKTFQQQPIFLKTLKSTW